jgi:hypothetical protein
MPKQRKLPEIDLKSMFREMVAEVDEGYIRDALKPHIVSITYLLKNSSGNLARIIDRLKSENFPGTKDQLRRIIMELCGEPDSLEDEEEDGQNIPKKSKGRPSKKTQNDNTETKQLPSINSSDTPAEYPTSLKENAEGNGQLPDDLSSTASKSSKLPLPSNNASIASDYQPPIPNRQNPELIASVQKNRAERLKKEQQEAER